MKSRSHNQIVHFDDKAHEALMGIWWTGILLRKNAKRFFSNYLSSEVQFNIMMILKYAAAPLTQNEISEQLLVDKSNITGMIDRMEKAGLLRRAEAPHDRRCHHIELTGAGHEIIDKVEQPYRDYIRELMNIFSTEEIAAITNYMERLQQAVSDENIAALSR